MRNLILGVGAAALATALAPFTGAQASLTDDQRRKALLIGVEIEDDTDLRKKRGICDRGEMDAFGKRMEAQSVPYPRAYVICRKVLFEEAKRGRLPNYRHRVDHENIERAARERAFTYIDFQGRVHTLSCAEAYDAGYQYGMMIADQSFQPNLLAKANEHAEQCFIDGELHPSLGFVAGAHHGQEDWQKLN